MTRAIPRASYPVGSRFYAAAQRRQGQPARYPGYLPYPAPLGRKPVPPQRGYPNAQVINWAQSQLAPLYLPPGKGSVTPFHYPSAGTTRYFPSSYSAGYNGALGATAGTAGGSGYHTPHWFKTVQLVAAPVAMGVAYYRTKSIWKTLAAGLFALPYLVYVGVSTAAK